MLIDARVAALALRPALAVLPMVPDEPFAATAEPVLPLACVADRLVAALLPARVDVPSSSDGGAAFCRAVGTVVPQPARTALTAPAAIQRTERGLNGTA